ncbi:hypothetical protein IP88_04205 [alpha proteobacterium AAP81b]|nr:hypothetical protein IP88_04205 [alpha proteobacterium AAP81b]
MPGERHVSEVAGRGPLVSKKGGIGMIVAAAGLACGFVVMRGASAEPGLKVGNRPPVQVKSVTQYEAPPELPPAPTDSMAALPPDAAPPLPDAPVDPRLASAPMQQAPSQQVGAAAPTRGQQTLLVYSSNGGSSLGAASGATPVAMQQSVGSELGARLQPTQLDGVTAAVLRNQPYLLTAGTLIPCVLQTAMDSTLPGLVTCIVPQDVMGKTGVTLLDRGTRIIGEFQGGVRQGQARLFVLWTRAETPQGVVISLASPASDALGRAGMGGAVDNHFWQRFGGALLLSTINGAIQAGVAAASNQGTTTINTGTPEAVIGESLRDSIRIPPTVRKAQGELVSVFVARDLDFSGVYQVQATAVAAGAPGAP